MGRAKAWELEQYERGYSETDGEICSECVSDHALVDWIKGNATSEECSFCGAKANEPIASSFDDFIGVVLDGIQFEWNHPDSEGIMYVSRDGGYQAAISDSWEVLSDYDISENQDVMDALIGAIETDGWVERNYYIGSESQNLIWGWDGFKEFVTNISRFFFLHPQEDDNRASYEITPSTTLERISDIIREQIKGHSLIDTIAPDIDLMRIRIDIEAHDTAKSIGTPKSEFAKQSNRMSPAGIPMFYGAYDFETAKAETYDPEKDAENIISVGTFHALRDLNVLDLANLPDIPSVFDPDTRELIHSLRFLHAFGEDISKPIARDGREHIEYVPTQIVTEYFRRVFKLPSGKPLDGILYRSSKNEGYVAFVLFCENDQCIENHKHEKGLQLNEPLLQLMKFEHQ